MAFVSTQKQLSAFRTRLMFGIKEVSAKIAYRRTCPIPELNVTRARLCYLNYRLNQMMSAPEWTNVYWCYSLDKLQLEKKELLDKCERAKATWVRNRPARVDWMVDALAQYQSKQALLVITDKRLQTLTRDEILRNPIPPMPVKHRTGSNRGYSDITGYVRRNKRNDEVITAWLMAVE
jgi:hypothetical protein